MNHQLGWLRRRRAVAVAVALAAGSAGAGDPPRAGSVFRPVDLGAAGEVYRADGLKWRVGGLWLSPEGDRLVLAIEVAASAQLRDHCDLWIHDRGAAGLERVHRGAEPLSLAVCPDRGRGAWDSGALLLDGQAREGSAWVESRWYAIAPGGAEAAPASPPRAKRPLAGDACSCDGPDELEGAAGVTGSCWYTYHLQSTCAFRYRRKEFQLHAGPDGSPGARSGTVALHPTLPLAAAFYLGPGDGSTLALHAMARRGEVLASYEFTDLFIQELHWSRSGTLALRAENEVLVAEDRDLLAGAAVNPTGGPYCATARAAPVQPVPLLDATDGLRAGWASDPALPGTGCAVELVNQRRVTDGRDVLARAWMSSRQDLWVDVSLVQSQAGTTWHTGAKRWIFDDHLELWASPAAACLGPTSALHQWGISMDGRSLVRAHGSPAEDPRVEVVELPAHPGHPGTLARQRFHLRLPYPAAGISVALSLGDGRSRQLQMYGHTPLVRGDPANLALVARPLAGAVGTACRVVEARVVPAPGSVTVPFLSGASPRERP